MIRYDISRGEDKYQRDGELYKKSERKKRLNTHNIYQNEKRKKIEKTKKERQKEKKKRKKERKKERNKERNKE